MTLITPVATDPVKNFIAVNNNNLNEIDSQIGPLTVQTYIPVLTSSTSPSLGAGGIIAGFYYVVFDLVFTWGYFKFGTGFNTGAGTYQVTLPFTADSNLKADGSSGEGIQLGSGMIREASHAGGRQPTVVQLASPTQIFFNICAETSTSTRAISGTGGGIPLTFEVDDMVTWGARYKR